MVGFVAVVFFIPTAAAWYLMRKEAMQHVALVLAYGGAMVVLSYLAAKIFVTPGHTGEETVGNVFKAYTEHGGSIVLAIAGVALGVAAGEYAFEQDS